MNSSDEPLISIAYLAPVSVTVDEEASLPRLGCSAHLSTNRDERGLATALPPGPRLLTPRP